MGCLVEIGGYIGRVIMYGNPFDFIGFMTQIGKVLSRSSPSDNVLTGLVLITSGPVFYTAAIYITLSKT